MGKLERELKQVEILETKITEREKLEIGRIAREKLKNLEKMELEMERIKK